jgi:flagellar hook-basal body complex protein FliE
MPVDSVGSLAPLPRLEPLVPKQATADTTPANGFAAILNNMLATNQQANTAADVAIHDLATGEAQDLHTVSLAVAQADMSFRLILELRNRLSDALQEITRMQV